MKMRTFALLLLATVASSLAAMPTKQELKQVEGLVQELMRPEVDAMKAGKKNRADVAKAAVALAEKAESDAAKLLLLKGSFTLYVGHGAFDEAIDVLRTIRTTIPDVSPQHVANMVESALRNIPKNRGGQLYRILDDAKARVRHQDALKAALEKSAKRPSLRALHVEIAEHYAFFGDWSKALDEFAKGDNAKAAEVAKAEKGGGKMSQKAIAEFWWSYAATEEDMQRAFRRHAAEVYAAAIASGSISGLETVLAQRRIDEAKEYGEDLLAPVEKTSTPSGGKVAVSGKLSNALYCVVDLSAGPNASKYPVSYLAAEPKGGWTDEYKTTKLVLRRIEPGKFKMCGQYDVTLTKPYYMGVFEVTQKQYELVTGDNPSYAKNDMRPVEKVSWNAIRGDSATYNWPSSVNVDSSTFIGKIQARTGLNFDLPTEAQWEYACRAGTTSAYNNGSNSKDDLNLLGRYRHDQSDAKGGYSDTHTAVGSYRPNAWGLYDMHGNVWEWCLDWTGPLSSGISDPVGASSGTRRVIRGGSFFSGANECASSSRNIATPPIGSDGRGFRLCLNPEGSVGASARGSGTLAASGGLYCVIDLSAGSDAGKYPVSYLAAEPKGGWTDEYKTKKLVLRRIEPGKFKMGGEYEVTLTKPYYMGVFEVTQKQYELVTGSNPSERKGDMRPVEQVSWNMIRGDSSKYNWPSSANVDPSTFMGKIRARTGLKFDLPTEAQWEYACRAGTTSSFNNGGNSEADLKKLGRFALNQKIRGWKESDADFVRHVPDGKGGYWSGHTVVGSYLPNAWGLYDMHGNVGEWCLDWHGNLSSGVTDPLGSSPGSDRVVRGGGNSNSMKGASSSVRIRFSPSFVGGCGFRLARTLSN